jgi:organic radical activating enzyme
MKFLREDLLMSLFYHKHQFVPLDRTLELYFTGCSLKCPNCHNAFLQERTKENSRELSVGEIIEELRDYVGVCSQVHILGGEPMEQNLNEMSELLKALREELGFTSIILFTGWDFPYSFVEKNWFLFQYCDYIKIGHYDENQKNDEKELIPNSPAFPLASKNQSFIRVNKIER